MHILKYLADTKMEGILVFHLYYGCNHLYYGCKWNV